MHCKIPMDTHPCIDNFHPQSSLLLRCNLRLQESLRIVDRLPCQDCLFKEVIVSQIDFLVKIVFLSKEVIVSQIDFIVKIVSSRKSSYHR